MNTHYPRIEPKKQTFTFLWIALTLLLMINLVLNASQVGTIGLSISSPAIRTNPGEPISNPGAMPVPIPVPTAPAGHPQPTATPAPPQAAQPLPVPQPIPTPPASH